jgi:hypothetical protein
MIVEPAYWYLAAQVLRGKPADVRARSSNRDAGIASIARAITERSQRIRRRRALVAGTWLAAAASLVLGLGWLGVSQLFGPGRSATMECSEGRPCTAIPAVFADVGRFRGRKFEPGQAVALGPGEHSVIEFPTGTRVTVRQNTNLDYQPNPSTQRFRLARGGLHLSVAKLRLGRRLVVQTPDAEVEVHGTVFDVAVSPGVDRCSASRTRVSVQEGVVEVRLDGERHRLAAGSSWPPPCPDPSAPPTDVPLAARKTHPAPAAAHVTGDPSPLMSALAEPEAEPATGPKQESVAEQTPAASVGDAYAVTSQLPVMSALTDQNDLFLSAKRARQQGRLREALAGYELLLRRYPQSPLTEAALMERMRLSRKLDPAGAAEQARSYLQLFPHGFGRREAIELTEGP